MPLLATTIFRHTLRTRTFGMIVRRTRVLYRTKLFHGLRTLAGHHFHRSRTRFRRLFLTLVAGVLHVVRGSFRFGLRLRIVHFAGFAHFAGFEGLVRVPRFVGFVHFAGFAHCAGFAHFVGFALFVGFAAFVRRPTQYGLLRLRRQRTAFRSEEHTSELHSLTNLVC